MSFSPEIRSAELRRLLVPEHDVKDIRSRLSKINKNRFDEPSEVSESEREERQTALLADIENLKQKMSSLKENNSHLSEEEFDHAIQVLEDEKQNLIDRVYSLDTVSGKILTQRREFLTEMQGWEHISNAETLLDARGLLYWVPGKQDIARICAVGLHAYAERKMHAATGDIPEPLRVIDVGGGNAALGQLLVEYAREQGFSIEYVVVDTDKEIVDAAQSHFRESFPELKFFHGTGSDYACEIYKDQEPLASYIREKQSLSHFFNRRCKDIAAILKSVKGSGENFSDTFSHALDVLRRDFQLDIDLDGVDILTKGIYHCQNAAIDQIFHPGKVEIEELTKKIETELKKQSPSVDLVLNSWMMPNMDYTADVRMLNGAAVVYALNESGSTGLNYRVESLNSNVEWEESYKPGLLYRESAHWKINTRNDVAKSLGQKDFEGNSYGKIRVQLRDFLPDGEYDPQKQELSVRGMYPWEKSSRGKVVVKEMPIIKYDASEWE